MTDTQSALLAAVLADPADDTARLVYADWLEENAGEVECPKCKGHGYYYHRVQAGRDLWDKPKWEPYKFDCDCSGPTPDSRAERAEFIRVQVELGDRVKEVALLDSDPDHLYALRKRERVLLDRHWREWAPRITSDGMEVCANLIEKDRPEPRVEFRRGFVAEVRCSLAAFLGKPCGRSHCRGGRVTVGPRHTMACAFCTPGVAAKLFGCQPVERVTLTDDDAILEPVINRGTFHVRFNIRRALGNSPSIERDFPTRDAAIDALSAACVKYGRNLAKKEEAQNAG